MCFVWHHKSKVCIRKLRDKLIFLLFWFTKSINQFRLIYYIVCERVSLNKNDRNKNISTANCGSEKFEIIIDKTPSKLRF